ncbi:MAG: DUF2905 domain-containing protein [Armatimonadetes bacterium]|nr:DUF2905 domain-containing protein [Armatimonadota bacterium]
MGRLLLFAGLGIAGLGLLLMLGHAAPGLRVGRLPGDIRVEREGFSFYFPLTTMVLASLALSGAVWLLGRLRR